MGADDVFRCNKPHTGMDALIEQSTGTVSWQKNIVA